MAPAKIAFAAVVIAYPLVVYFGLGYFEARVVALVMISIALLRFLLIRRLGKDAPHLPHAPLIIGALLVVGFLAMASNSTILLQYYPVCMNGLMFIIFSYSLVYPPSVIEKIARITTPNLPEAGVSYTRKVTIVWCLFFAVNGTMSLYTVLDTSMGFWAIYNGLISYFLMGMLFAGEYAVRRYVQSNTAQSRGARGWL
jgi:uncharacterized membrane protein